LELVEKEDDDDEDLDALLAADDAEEGEGEKGVSLEDDAGDEEDW
jgi:hypothetical protein